MLEEVPPSVSLIFSLTTLYTLLLLLRAVSKGKTDVFWLKPAGVAILSVLWLGLQGFLSYSSFYSNHLSDVPPRFAVLILPPLLAIACLFLTTKGRLFIDSLPLIPLTWIHTARIPVEMVLYYLFLHHAVPELMTFAGLNFDIMAGITAPLIIWFGFKNLNNDKRFVLFWNYLALGLLLNIVVNAILAAPTPFQATGFEQPNIGVFFFPFSWLPAFVVPVVLFSHLVSIRRLRKVVAKMEAINKEL